VNRKLRLDGPQSAHQSLLLNLSVPFALVARRFLLGAQGTLTGDVTTEPGGKK
jgi:hypothetical protein